MNEITITLPAIDETVIANLETLSIEVLATETEALRVIREKYAPLAKQNGYIQIADYSVSASNYSFDKELYLERDGKRLRALKCFDSFDSNREDQNSGSLDGHRLYLAATGEWIELERVGHWSTWQGSPNWWGCGKFVGPEGWQEEPRNVGHVRTMTDAEVAEEYNLDKLVEHLGKSLKTLAEKLPARMVLVQQRAALASQLLDRLK